VTRDGTAAVAYRSPSMDDRGVIVAGHGDEIVRMRQSGEVLSHFDPPPAVDSTGDTIDGVPQNVARECSMARIHGVPQDQAGPMVKLVYRFMRNGMKEMTGREATRGSGLEPIHLWAHQPARIRRLLRRDVLGAAGATGEQTGAAGENRIRGPTRHRDGPPRSATTRSSR